MIKFREIFVLSKRSSRSAYQEHSSGKFPFYTSSPIQNKFVDFADYSGASIIIGLGGTPNIHFNENEFSVSSECLVFKPINNNINTKYYYYYLLANMQLLEAGFRGVGIMRTTKRFIDQIQIPQPATYQQQITITLDKVYYLVRSREKSISLLEQLSESIFLGLVGDTVVNPNEWEVCPIKEVVQNVIRGKNIDEASIEDEGDLIGHNFIVYEYFHTYDNNRIARKVIKENIYEKYETYQVNESDILICNIGQNVGKASIVTDHHRPGVVNQTLIKCRVDENIILKEVFTALINNLNFRRKYFLFREWQSLYLKLPPIRSFIEIEIPIPDRQRQFEYVKILNVVSEHNRRLNKSLVFFNDLFNSILSSEIEIDNEKELDDLIMSYTIEDFSYNRRRSILLEYIQGTSSSFSSFDKYNKARDILFALMKQGEIIQTFENDSMILSQK